MKNYIGPSKIVTVAAPAAATSGAPLVSNGVFLGIPQASAASGANVALLRDGIAKVDKTTGTAYSVGDPVFWDVAGLKTVDLANARIGTDPYMGQVRKAAASGATSCEVIFDADASNLFATFGSLVSSSGGAALVGIEDAGGLYVGATVEAALQELTP